MKNIPQLPNREAVVDCESSQSTTPQEAKKNELIASFNEFVQKHYKCVLDKFPVKRLKQEFGLSERYAIIVQMYAVSNNLTASGIVAGFPEASARQNAYAAVHTDKGAKALEMIRYETDSLIEERRVIITNKCVERLEQIVESGTDRDAIAAVSVMQKFLDQPIMKPKGTEKEEQKENVVLNVQQELESMGVYEGSLNDFGETYADKGTAEDTEREGA